MPNNILITPASASIQFSGSAANTIRLQVESSGSVAFYGNSGSLFGITDSLSGSLMSVNDISGLPILEVFSDDRVVMGTFNRNTLVVTGSRVGIDKANPQADLDISGSVMITGSLGISSNTLVTNLNADLLDGNHGSAFYLASNPSGYTSNTGTVTSVGGTGTVSGLTLSGTVTTTGNLTLGGTLSVAASNFASQTANTFLAAPNGSAGTPTFRAIVAADVPTLNQNTTGTASNITAYTINQNLGTSNSPQWLYIGVNPAGTSNNGYGISLYGGASTSPTYGIFFQGTSTYGTHAAVSADWATYFTMDSTANRGWIFRNQSTGTNVASINNAGRTTIASLGVNTTASSTNGEIRATNEITAYYSDARLKNFHGVIPNAGEKVALLNGYYFTENETAKSLGYTNDKMQIGVSAQEVQAVLPEAVVPAPIDDKYLTVKYEKLVPLLIEAIKELQTEVAELKTRITG